MHVVCMRRALAEEHPWLPMNLLRAFEESKRNSIERLKFPGMSRYPLPWGSEYAARSTAIFGADFWPYGVDSNRPTLDAFTRYAFEHGVARRQLDAAEMFAEHARDLKTSYGEIGATSLGRRYVV